MAVQGDLESTAHGRAVDERERRYVGILQAPEHPMAQPADLERLFA